MFEARIVLLAKPLWRCIIHCMKRPLPTCHWLNYLALSWLIAFLLTTATAAPNPPRLVGIVSCGNHPIALVADPIDSLMILKPTQTQGDYQLMTLKEREGKVTLSDRRLDQTLTLSIGHPLSATAPPLALNLADISDQHLILLYQHLAQRTVIVSPLLTGARITFKKEAPISKEEALTLIRDALAQHDIILRDHGDKFAVAVNQKQVDHLDKLPPLPDAQEQTLPEGVVRFINASLEQVLPVYAQLANRVVLPKDPLPSLSVSLKSQTSLSKPELLWALEATLQLGGLLLIPEADRFVYAVPPRLAENRLRFTPTTEEAQAPRISSLNFENASLRQVLPVYAQLTDRKPDNLPFLPAFHISVRGSELSRPEAIFALEALLRLNGIRPVSPPNAPDKVTFQFDPALIIVR